MGELVISRAPVAVTFRTARRDGSDDPYSAGSFVVHVHAEGLEVTQPVFMFDFDWTALAAFFRDLADSWQGWKGEKSWRSIERDLVISASTDGLGHCNLTFEVRDGPVPTWSARVGDVQIDSGEDLSNLARTMASWVEALPRS